MASGRPCVNAEGPREAPRRSEALSGAACAASTNEGKTSQPATGFTAPLRAFAASLGCLTTALPSRIPVPGGSGAESSKIAENAAQKTC
ncbi:hypothetical protein BD626DRAFT_490176 [Schizophyllum amplum]|uniref:Uncharacterized protein n=1 Tax=Schizophyllum amplum TaxID=97359 RepID=A0A550CJA7_9AGAR|nr:hypothetical protein BD626DRAFT_490176 [Auriculariopsis ampla]